MLNACTPDFSALNQPLDDIAESATPNADQAADGAGEITVGLLHSLSGPLAFSEAPLVDAEIFAIEEINAAGGLLGKQLVPFIEDGASDWPTFAEKAEKLITQHQTTAIFGGFTTASRKAILPVMTAKNQLLWYPSAYEGQACSQNILYGGAIANQQVEPALTWMLNNRGKSFFLLSDNDRVTHEIAKSLLKEKGGKVAGEAFVPLENGSAIDMSPVVNDIEQALPEGGIILNSLVGDQNRVFFQALQSAGLSSDRHLVLSLRIAEEEVFQIGRSFLQGHYAAWPYFQTIKTPDNEKWGAAFQDRFGFDRVIGSPMVAAYSMVHLWAQAVQAAETFDTAAVRAAVYEQTFQSPGGPVTMTSNHHVAQKTYVGQVREDGLFNIMWAASEAIAPKPWNPRLSGDTTFLCDWSDPQKGEQYTPEEATS